MEQVKCWDCKELISKDEAVQEYRQTSGGGGVVLTGDFTMQWVHADRRPCKEFTEKRGNEARIKGAEDWVASCERQLAEAKLKLVAARKDK